MMVRRSGTPRGAPRILAPLSHREARSPASPAAARATNGHATAAPSSAASNSPRPIVTVIRPSRARRVKATIPRHERAVLTARHPARAGHTPGAAPQVRLSGLMRSAEAGVEASDRDGRRRATEQGRRRSLGRALRLGARLSLRRRLGHESNCSFLIRWLRSEFGRMGFRCHRGMFRLGGRRLGLRRRWLDRRLVVRHRSLILAPRSEQIAYKASDAA